MLRYDRIAKITSPILRAYGRKMYAYLETHFDYIVRQITNDDKELWLRTNILILLHNLEVEGADLSES